MSDFSNGNSPERLQRVRSIVEDITRRRSRGEAISDESVFAEYPDLADVLRIELNSFSLSASTDVNSSTPNSPNAPVGSLAATAKYTSSEAAQLPARLGADDLSIGRNFGRYKIISEIARGGMGIVYTARQTDLDRVVCMKVLHAGGATGEWLVREALLLAKFSHPNIVPIYDAGVIDGRYFYTMEYVEGRTLAQAIDGRPMDPRIAAGVALEIATALAYAHDRGIIHRDIKPRNVLISTQVGGGSMRPDDWHAAQVRVADFGLAMPISESSTGATLNAGIVGTPAYMSPEQAYGEKESLDARSDVYSLGVVLFEMLTGTPPYSNLPMRELLRRVRDEKAPSPLASAVLPNVDHELELVGNKAMRKDRDGRYKTAEEMADDLRRYLIGEKVLANLIGGQFEKKLAIAGILAACLLAAVAAAGIVVDPFGIRTPSLISWNQADKHVGKTLQVEMLGTYATIKGDDLALDPAPGDPSAFEAIIPADLRSSLPAKLDPQYQQQRVVVRGRVEGKDGRPSIRLANSQDLRFERPLTSEERVESGTRFARLQVPRDENLVNWRDASKHIGEDVTVEGNVLAVGQTETSVLINVGFLGRQSVNAIIFAEYLQNFGSDLKNAYTGKRIRVAGRLTTREGQPEIHLRLPTQVKVVGTASGEFENNGPPVPSREAGAHLNELATVEGNVTSIPSVASGFYLNFDNAGPNSGFCGYIASDSISDFPDGFQTFYLGKRIQIAGEVYLHGSNTVIRLVHPYQIRILGTAPDIDAPSSAAILAADAGDYVGERRTVRGRVSDVRRDATYAYINFEESENQKGIALYVPQSGFEHLPDGFETYYVGREILATGEIYLYRGHLFIKVIDKRQIQVVPKSEESNAKQLAGDRKPTIDPQDAADNVGQRCTVRGRVKLVDRRENFAHIDLEQSDPARGLNVLVFASSFGNLPNGFEQFYEDRDVLISGTIKTFEGRPTIVITSGQQITVLPRTTEAAADSSKTDAAPPPEIISVADTSRFVDKVVTVDAVVDTIERKEAYSIIDFKGVGLDGFYVFVGTSAVEQLPDGFEHFFLGKRLQVTGLVQLHQGRPQIKVTKASQIRVVYDEPAADNSTK